MGDRLLQFLRCLVPLFLLDQHPSPGHPIGRLIRVKPPCLPSLFNRLSRFATALIGVKISRRDRRLQGLGLCAVGLQGLRQSQMGIGIAGMLPNRRLQQGSRFRRLVIVQQRNARHQRRFCQR